MSQIALFATCRPCGRVAPVTPFDMGRMGVSWKGQTILICAECREAAGKGRALGMVFDGDLLRCVGDVGTRQGAWTA